VPRREIPSIVPGSIPNESEGTAIPRVDRPHSQAVCRGCGRILELALELGELRDLAELADRAPEGWRIDGLSFTLTGLCTRCRTNDRS
jgi:Fe2+ or Zn2+ uptake regulation protein